MSADTTRAGKPAGARPADPEATARRVEELLDSLAASGGAGTAATAEELVRVLMEFYGAGLARLAAALERHAGADADRLRAALLADDLVGALLVLHDLHPEDVATRVDRALAKLGSSAPELLELDTEAGRLRLRERPATGGCGCSGGGADQEALAAALACHAPEVTDVVVEPAHREPPLLQIGTRPTTPAAAGPAS